MSLCQSPTCPRVTQSHTPQSNLHKTIFVNLVSPNPLTKLPASYCLVREKGSGRNILFWSTYVEFKMFLELSIFRAKNTCWLEIMRASFGSKLQFVWPREIYYSC